MHDTKEFFYHLKASIRILMMPIMANCDKRHRIDTKFVWEQILVVLFVVLWIWLLYYDKNNPKICLLKHRLDNCLMPTHGSGGVSLCKLFAIIHITFISSFFSCKLHFYKTWYALSCLLPRPIVHNL